MNMPSNKIASRALRLGHGGAPMLMLLSCLLASGSGCACWNGIEGRQEVALRSTTRAIVVRNVTAGPLLLLPAPDAPAGAALITIAPGANASIRFDLARVVRVNLLSRSDHGWFYDKGDQASVRLTSANAARYIDMAGPDAMFRLKRADGEIWEFRVELGDCLFDKAPGESYEVKIEGPPDLVTPLRLCR